MLSLVSLVSRSALSSLSSCVVTLDERDGSDERDGRGDDVGFHVGSFRTEISCRGPRRHENRRTGGRGSAGGGADGMAGEQVITQGVNLNSPVEILGEYGI